MKNRIKSLLNRETIKTVVVILLIAAAVGAVAYYKMWSINHPARVISKS